MKTRVLLLLTLFSVLSIAQAEKFQTGSVIFIHPDGTSLSDWNALRILTAGPDSEINWDKLSGIGLYQGHIKNRITASSNAGATIHAYGIKADLDAFGMDNDDIPISLSGKKLSIMQEAKGNGIYTGLINSGSIIEPGTAVFVASETKRSNYDAITKKVIESGTDLIFSGGENWLLPKGVKGKFVESGERKDGLNLIDYAGSKGYKIVYTKYDLASLSPNEEKVLGVFAAEHTFNDLTEEDQQKLNLPNYVETAPTLKEMTDYALKFFANKGKFFLVIEEEGTDNFGNRNNAKGKLDALKRADDAIGSVFDFIKNNSNTLLVTAADSEAGGMEVAGYEIDNLDANTPLPAADPNGSPIDGVNGTSSLPFMSAPDSKGNRFPFGIAWATYGDVTGSVIARAHGLNSERMKGKVDNTFIYRLMYYSLFGKWFE
ncbi:MAG: alkaline phosphatase [Ignavibacteria bacterium]|nr:MAG: alkaline phosphatase [Ignavibacteria bacterium]KAF0158105.1 MAG: alkaline phosphatase [Ignavibacteria bacterium]